MRCITFDRYIEAFHVLEKFSEEYPFMLRHLLDLTRTHDPGGISILDIGAGTGVFAKSFLTRCTIPVRSYTAIEPSGNHVRQLQENLRGIPVETEIIPDFFTPHSEFNKKFDLVLLSHCTYCFMPDPTPYLKNAFGLVADHGRAVCYHGAPPNFCSVLNFIYNDILPENRIADPTFTSWNVRDILERDEIPHTVTYLPGYLRAGTVFSQGNTTLLHNLITFSLLVEAESLEPVLLKRTEEILREIAYPSTDGPRLNLGVDAIVVDAQDA